MERVLEVLLRWVAVWVLSRNGGLTNWVVGAVSRSLVAPVELVVPHALKEVVGDTGPRRRLIKAAEFDVCRRPGGHVEDVKRGVRPGGVRLKQVVVGDAGWKVLVCKS